MQTTAVQELSTQTLAVRDRFPFWADVVTQALVPLECDTSDQQNFVGTIRYRRIGMMSVADVQATPMRVRRTRATIAQEAGDDMIVAIHVAGGCRVGQGSSVITMTNNLGAAVVTRARYQFEFSNTFHQVVLKLPCGLLRGPVDAMGGDVVRLPANASKLVNRLALAILEEPNELSVEEQSGIERAFAELVRPSLSSSAVRAATAHGEPRLIGAVEFIRSHLSDQMLCPSSVAAHVSLSSRSLARLFAQEGTTVDRTIWHERLSAARRALSDPASRELSITEIAFGCGFNDLSHFTRSFSRMYGAAPSLYRAEQRRTWLPGGGVAGNAEIAHGIILCWRTRHRQVLALLTGSLFAKEAGSGLIRSPFPKRVQAAGRIHKKYASDPGTVNARVPTPGLLQQSVMAFTKPVCARC